MHNEHLQPLQNLWQQQIKAEPTRNPTMIIIIPKPPNCGGVKQYDQNRQTSFSCSGIKNQIYFLYCDSSTNFLSILDRNCLPSRAFSASSSFFWRSSISSSAPSASASLCWRLFSSTWFWKQHIILVTHIVIQTVKFKEYITIAS